MLLWQCLPYTLLRKRAISRWDEQELMMKPIVCQSALDAVSLIQSGETLWTHSMGATPRVLLDALAKHALTKDNL
ncbi:MAG: 4-hydroxybutyrate CoA-transferase, partial [Shewanella sp.]